MVTILLMVIGGSPGSTAGGIKTTAIAIIALTAIARVRGKETPEFANRSIAQRSVADAITLTTISTVFILMLIMALQVTENGSVPHTQVAGALMELSFEGVSAFGTVGLSMGVTADLTGFGRLIIILAMFVGRLGPLTFFSLLGRGGGKKQQYRLYSESVMVG
jgi:trk system potassium uptake protein TrkH